MLRDNVSLRPDMYPCSLCWKDNTTLIVGWGTSIKVCFVSCSSEHRSQAPAVAAFPSNRLISLQICVVKERNPTEMRDLPSRYVEIGTKCPISSSAYETAEKYAHFEL